jgi:hypothetical protein
MMKEGFVQGKGVSTAENPISDLIDQSHAQMWQHSRPWANTVRPKDASFPSFSLFRLKKKETRRATIQDRSSSSSCPDRDHLFQTRRYTSTTRRLFHNHRSTARLPLDTQPHARVKAIHVHVEPANDDTIQWAR